MRGRLVFPAVNALVANAQQPFPRIGFAEGRCGLCKATGIGFVVLPAGTGGFSAVHADWCTIA